MFKHLLIVLISAILLLIPSSSQAQETNAQVTGTVAYRERMALPSDAVIDVQLLDTSIADVAAQTVAEVLINAEGRQVPVPFTLTYGPTKIEPAHRYSVRATIRSGDGMLMFSSTQAYPVLSHGAPSKANLILHTVGHGAHPAASAKKEPAAAASESTASASQASSATAPEANPPATTPPPPSGEAAPGATTPSSQEPEKPAAQAEAKAAQPDEKPAQTETAVTPPSSKPPESASAPATEPTAAPPAEPTSPGTTPPAESSAATTPEAQTSLTESKPGEPQAATPEQTTPPASKREPITATPEAKTTEADAPLPEAPSASKQAELEATAPVSAEPEGESTSRPEKPAANKALTPLADTQWKLIQLNGQAVDINPPQKPVTLAFSPEGRRIAGSAGCNSYLGSFTDDHGRLHLSPGNMTMMACGDPAGSRERKFVAMLRSADGYKINGDFLLLTSNGKTVAKFKNNQF